jgi:hypothetical protein
MAIDEDAVRARLLGLLEAERFRALKRADVSQRYNRLICVCNDLLELKAAGRGRGAKRKILSGALGPLLIEAGWPKDEVPLIAGPLCGSWAWAFKLGCFPASRERMLQGRSATVTHGRFQGEKLHVEHALPVDVVPELTTHLANLRLWPASLNLAKGTKVFAREARQAWRYAEIGLIDARVCSLIQHARNRDRSVRRGRTPTIPAPTGVHLRPVDPAELEARIRDVVYALGDVLPYLEWAVRDQLQFHPHLLEQVSVLEASTARLRHEAEDIVADADRLEAQRRRLIDRQKVLRVRRDSLHQWTQASRVAVDEALRLWQEKLTAANRWRDDATRAYAAALRRESEAEAALDSIQEANASKSSSDDDVDAGLDACQEELDAAREELAEAKGDLEAATEQVAMCEGAVKIAEAASARAAQAREALADFGVSEDRAEEAAIQVTRDSEALLQTASELGHRAEETLARLPQVRNAVDEMLVRGRGLKAQQESCADLARRFGLDIGERLDALRRFNFGPTR